MKHPTRLLALSLATSSLLFLGACGGGGGGGDDDPTNTNPAITSGATASVVENTTAVATVTATDADSDTLTYSITGGADQALFAVTPATGALTFAAPPDFENPGDANDDNAYAVQVTVSDGNGGTDAQDLTVTVTDLNEAGSLHGVAAAGAPIVGTVTVKDSLGEWKTVLIEADGSYDVDVSDMTGPFALRADGHVGGRDYQLYSAATDADTGGTINITPFTDLILANIAGDIASAYFDNGDFSGLTTDEIAAAETALQEKLQPILEGAGLDASIDLLRTSFSADHSALDGVLDVVRVTVDPETLTADIVNILTDNSVSMDVETGAFTGDFSTDDGAAVQSGLTDLQKIVAGFDTFTALFATSLPQEDAPALLALFDQDPQGFLHDGMRLNQFLSDPTSDPNLIGIKFTNVTVVSLDPVAGTGEVGFDVVLGGKAQTDAPNRFKMVRKTADGPWVMQGNQHLIRTHIEVTERYRPYENVGGQFETGFNFSVRDDGGASNVDYVIVRGPGLPTNGLVPEGGVVLVKDIADDEFTLFDPQPQYTTDQLPLGDAAIDQIPEYGAEYTFTLWNANGTPDNIADDIPLGGTDTTPYTTQLRARPYKLSQLTAANFPSITAPSIDSWRAFTGGTVNVSWTIPADCWSDYVFVYLAAPDNSVDTEAMVGPDATSTSLTIPAPSFTVQWRNLEVGVLDEGGRSLTTNLY